MLITYTTSERDLLARLMRAEAISDGDYAMLMVGNVVVNRVLADCYTFKDINTVTDAIYQANQFSGISNSLFQASATTHEQELADRVLTGKYYYPATNALWFYAPSGSASCVSSWYDQYLIGRYKSHCFYNPYPGVCRQLH